MNDPSFSGGLGEVGGWRDMERDECEKDAEISKLKLNQIVGVKCECADNCVSQKSEEVIIRGRVFFLFIFDSLLVLSQLELPRRETACMECCPHSSLGHKI